VGRRKQTVGDPAVAIGYCRVSTDRQELSPAVQEASIREWCDAHSVTLAGCYTDRGVSGAAPLERRAGLLEAVSELQERRAGLLIVAKWDRLARDTEKALVIERLVSDQGAKLASADGVANADTPEGRLLRTMLSGFSAYERDLIRMRTRVALGRLRSTGRRWACHAPYGWRWEAGKMTVEPLEAAAIVQILALTAEGKSRVAVKNAMNSDWKSAARAGQWHVTTIQRIVSRAGSHTDAEPDD